MPIRVLQIVTTMNRGGLETMLMNYYRHVDRSKVQFDFLVHRPEEGDYEKEIRSLGGRIYRVPALNPFSPAYFKALNSFFSKHQYDIVHCHLDCMSAVPLSVAKKHGVKHRFAHAHSISQDKDYKYFIKLIFKRFIPFFANELFACGNEAGNWMFNGKKFFAIPVSAFIVTTLRYLCHILSGILIWGVYAEEGQSILAYSIIYNGTYMLPEIIISTIVTAIIFKSKIIGR